MCWCVVVINIINLNVSLVPKLLPAISPGAPLEQRNELRSHTLFAAGLHYHYQNITGAHGSGLHHRTELEFVVPKCRRFVASGRAAWCSGGRCRRATVDALPGSIALGFSEVYCFSSSVIVQKAQLAGKQRPGLEHVAVLLHGSWQLHAMNPRRPTGPLLHRLLALLTSKP